MHQKGLPYVVAKTGLLVGLFYIVAFGLVMLFLNLMLGEISVRTNEELQLAGFAGKYLGTWAKVVLAITIIFSSYGVLLAYIIGEGESMAALFGGAPAFWSVLFWVFGSVMIWFGLQTIKKAEKFLSITVIFIIVGLSLFLLKKIRKFVLF